MTAVWTVSVTTRRPAMNLAPALRGQLLEKARQAATERGWPWEEPVEVKSAAFEGEGVWEILTNTMVRGGNVRVVIRRSDGEIVHAGFLSR